jgi:hypothetical protein
MGRTDFVEHKIELVDPTPIKQPGRRLPHARWVEAQKMLVEMEERGVIERSFGAWGSPVVFVPKKDGSLRMCVDFRRVNFVTRKDAYPLPLIQDVLSALAGSAYFSSLDLASGYWQVPMRAADKVRTAFSIQGLGLWQFRVMPFGLTNAVATFQRLMECVLAGITWLECVVYVDDVLSHAADFPTACGRLARIFGRLRAAGLKLSPKKCYLFQTQVKFLGFEVSAQGVEVVRELVRV